MILDAVSQEQLNNSNITATGTGSVATLKNSLGGKQLVYLQGNGYTQQDGTPTPESPIDIQCLGESGTIDIKTCGKNIASKIDNNGYVYQYGNVLKCYCILKPNTYYTISFDSDTEGNHYYTNESISDKQKHLKVVKGKNSVSIKTKANIKGNYLTNGVTLLKNYKEQPNKPMFDNFQLEEGEVVTDYEPYQESTASLPISKPLYEGDYIEVYADGTGQIVRNNYSGLLPKSGWTVTDETNSKQANIYSAESTIFGEPRQELLSTHFGNTNTNKIVYYRGSYWAKFPSEYTTEEITNIFANNDIMVVGKLPEPTVTPLTAEQVAEFRKLYTFDKLTHVTADGTAKLVVTGYHNNGDTMALFHKAGTEFIGEFKGDSTEVACDLNKYSCLIMIINYGSAYRDTDVIPVELLTNDFYIQSWYGINNDTLSINVMCNFRIESCNIGVMGSTWASNGVQPKGILYGVLK